MNTIVRDFTGLQVGAVAPGFRAGVQVAVCPCCGRNGVRIERTHKPNWKYNRARRVTEWLHSQTETVGRIAVGVLAQDSCKQEDE